MTTYLATALLLIAVTALAAHLVTGLLAWRWIRKPRGTSPLLDALPPVSIVRPVSGLTKEDEIALRSAFLIAYPSFEVIICAEREQDPAVAFCRSLMAEYPAIPAQMLVGRTRVSVNPKLDNIEKGWTAARHPWVIMADCNVLMPADYIRTMLAGWRDDCGLVCAPPVGIDPHNFWGDFECSFLNTYQARWQVAADAIGFGFAQGKSMLWNRTFLESSGGIAALSRCTAEDAAATKLVRDRKLLVRLADQPSVQPIGHRDFNRAWNRQLRWAQLRRQSFPKEFSLEPFTSGAIVFASLSAAAWLLSWPVLAVTGASMVLWYGSEALLARRAGWPLGWTSPFAWLLRDISIPVIWCLAWGRQSYVWNGKSVMLSPAKPLTQH